MTNDQLTYEQVHEFLIDLRDEHVGGWPIHRGAFRYRSA